jgi:hypothetical protein
MRFLHMSQFMLSLPSVKSRKKLFECLVRLHNVFATNKNIVCLQASSDPLIHSLFCRVKMASARVVYQIFISNFQLERE